uniref:Uncharacterized protein n=1 Tax=Aegilops tauschii subsp. strangulata TaxID=200361 RepID=A0A453P6S7_AEGTS
RASGSRCCSSPCPSCWWPWPSRFRTSPKPKQSRREGQMPSRIPACGLLEVSARPTTSCRRLYRCNRCNSISHMCTDVIIGGIHISIIAEFQKRYKTIILCSVGITQNVSRWMHSVRWWKVGKSFFFRNGGKKFASSH